MDPATPAPDRTTEPGRPESRITIAPATENDIPRILAFIRELAEYERLAEVAVVTESQLRESLFGLEPAAEVILADCDGEPAGFAVFFRNFSTFLGQPGIYLEDLYVRPALRGQGVGRALLAALARLAKERGCGRLEWSVLDWNESAIGFYKRLGAVPMNEWTVFRLTGAALEQLAEEGTLGYNN
jgi:GNAT superfamily N-acetyltransferase